MVQRLVLQQLHSLKVLFSLELVLVLKFLFLLQALLLMSSWQLRVEGSSILENGYIKTITQSGYAGTSALLFQMVAAIKMHLRVYTSI